MSQKLAVNRFEWVEEEELSKFNDRFIINCNENSNKGYIFEEDVEYPNILLNSHRDLAFLPKRRKIRGVQKLICGIEDKEKIKQTLNHGLILKEVHRVIQFNQKAWLENYIDLNTNYRKKQK